MSSFPSLWSVWVFRPPPLPTHPPPPPPPRHQGGGAAGTCGATLLGFKCKDGKRTGVPNVQYNATAKCHKVSNPSKRVKSRYTQNT